MAELRRILVEAKRIEDIRSSDYLLALNKKELHYLLHVLRLRIGDRIEIIDGLGHLWNGVVKDSRNIKLSSLYQSPQITIPKPYPLVSLALVVPKYGFDEFLRMSCEIGVDKYQPLRSARSSKFIQDRFHRWNAILTEAVEQSERLWKPELFPMNDIQKWMNNLPSSSAFAIGKTRTTCLNELNLWVKKLDKDINEVWILIGPEGGWTYEEESLAEQSGFTSTTLGDSILRTNTAGVVAAQIISSWRRL